MKRITMTPEAMAALNANGPIRPMSDKMIQVIRKGVARAMFGPTLRPTFRWQLLTFSSFAAIQASWAADNFQRRYRERNL